MNLTPHIVVTDAEAAAAWYADPSGAEERTRVPLPGGGVMTVELVIGDSSLHRQRDREMRRSSAADVAAPRPC